MHHAITTTDDALAHYRPHSASSPGALGTLYDPLPDDVPGLCRVVQNSIIHLFWIQEATYGITLELQDSPLTEPHGAGLRSVGCCRDFALMLVSILRHKGIPARMRTGVALYLDPNCPEDHYVAEFWNAAERRWQMTNAQIDDVQRKAMRISLDTTDVDPCLFLTAGGCSTRSHGAHRPPREGWLPAGQRRAHRRPQQAVRRLCRRDEPRAPGSRLVGNRRQIASDLVTTRFSIK